MTEGIYQLKVGNMANFTYVICDVQSHLAAIVDPSWDLQEIFHLLEEKKLKAKHVINTHSHFDHVLGNDEVAKVTGATIVQHSNSQHQILSLQNKIANRSTVLVDASPCILDRAVAQQTVILLILEQRRNCAQLSPLVKIGKNVVTCCSANCVSLINR